MSNINEIIGSDKGMILQISGDNDMSCFLHVYLRCSLEKQDGWDFEALGGGFVSSYFSFCEKGIQFSLLYLCFIGS